MPSQDKNEIIAELIRQKKLSNQVEILEHLESMGIEATQSSVSRSLKKLGVLKIDGYYRAPSIAAGESRFVDRLDARTAGDNMIVLRTGPGNADRAAVMIDEANISGIMGTIAGDDTIFCAVANKQDQSKVLNKIISLFSEG